ncbi:MAG: tetratricopeptide repeat protein [Saprospiraceae bacterium]|nr:tetratricopeptide repeat protein [Saprospiraceae bacterium]MCB9342314.1 tetratricopeptide repeat protein [Lewinellaceae bacterium]
MQDTQRLRAIQQLAYKYVPNQPDSARLLAEIQQKFAIENNLPAWEAKALNIIGLSYRMQSNYASALEKYKQSLILLKKTGDRNTMSAVYGNMGDIYRLQSNFPKAIECILNSLTLAEETGDKKKTADAYVSIATIYYEESENNSKSLEYLLKARELYELLGDKQGLTLVYGNLSSIYLDEQDNDKALYLLEKTLGFQQSMNDDHGAATSLYNRGVVYTTLGRYADAFADLKQATAIFQNIRDLEGLADALNAIGNLRLEQKQYSAAIEVCRDALLMSRDLSSYSITEMESCLCLSTAYNQSGQYRRALAYLQQYNEVKDSLQKQETLQTLKKMELARKSATDSLGREKERFHIEMEHQHAMREKNKLLVWFLVIGLLILIIALGFWIRMLYYQRRVNKLKAHSDNLEKQHLLYEIALLRSQVNPHFLFNSLSILSSLVRTNPDLSEQFIEQLSRSYRYILEQKEQSMVSLRTEIEFILAYFFLLKIRFEDKIELQINLTDNLLDNRKIAPLTLQLLIENAVKHNRMSKKMPLLVQVREFDSDNLVVENNLQPRPGPIVSTGLGLQNIVSRYALLSDKPVWAGETERGTFAVKIPYL